MNVLERHAYKRVHDKLSCKCLHNYTIVYMNKVYMNMAAVTKFIAKNNKQLHQPVKQRDILAT